MRASRRQAASFLIFRMVFDQAKEFGSNSGTA